MAKQTSELSWEKRLLIISYKNEKDQIFTNLSKNKLKESLFMILL